MFLLNVLAFLLMGLQARTIVGAHGAGRGCARRPAFALAVVVCLIVVRMAWVLALQPARPPLPMRCAATEPAPTCAQGVLVGWCGMRGLVTLATAFALPADFPAARPDRAHRLRRRAGDAGGPGPDPGAAGPPARARRRGRRRGRAGRGARRARRGRRSATLEGQTGRRRRSLALLPSRPPAPPRRRRGDCRRAATPSARSASPRSAASANGSRRCAPSSASAPTPS